MAQVGIWIDLNEAHLIKIKNNHVVKQTIKSSIDIGRVKGGSRSKKPWGPMDKVSESKQLAKREAQLKSYFENISNLMTSDDEILLLGPAQTKIRLKKFLVENKIVSTQAIEIKTTDSITANQLAAMVKEYFSLA